MKPGNWESMLSLLGKSETVLKITTQTDVTRTTFELDGKLAGPASQVITGLQVASVHCVMRKLLRDTPVKILEVRTRDDMRRI